MLNIEHFSMGTLLVNTVYCGGGNPLAHNDYRFSERANQKMRHSRVCKSKFWN